jgi:hypothetical protein
MTPKEWFDQFPILPGRVQSKDSQWCSRHWAPVPGLGADGLNATVELVQIFMDEIAPRSAVTAQQMQSALAQAGKICCRLGDERMYQIWSHWRPALES